jgi:hypothetical protein
MGATSTGHLGAGEGRGHEDLFVAKARLLVGLFSDRCSTRPLAFAG